MDEIQRQEIDGHVVLIDRLICVGFEDCVEAARDTFEMDADGIAVFREGSEATDRAVVMEAARSCPVDAIVILDPDGNQLHP